MASEKNMRMEEIGNGQQEMQEKIARRTKVVMNLTKGKGIIEGPNLQEELTSLIDGSGPFIVPNQNEPFEREQSRENLLRQSENINLQQKCNLLDKRLKKIEGMDDLESIDPRELSLVPDVVIPPKFKMPKFKKYDGTKYLENHLATYCNKMAGHARNEDLLIHMFYDNLAEATAQWYRGLKKNQIRTWRDLARAFLGRYKYMLETAPDRLTLQSMKKGPDEDYKEYAIR